MTSRRFGSSARLVAASVLMAGVAVLSACSAGKITQTSTQVAAVPGASADLGLIALRDLTVAYNGTKGYAAGTDAPLVVRIFNSGGQPVKLTKVTSNKAAEVVPVGGPATAPPPAPPSPTPTPRPSASASPSLSKSPGASAIASATITQSRLPTGQFPITIPAGGYVLLVPGQGQYLVLRGLKEALAPGYTTDVTFTFDNGASTTLAIPFGLPTEAGPRESAEHSAE